MYHVKKNWETKVVHGGGGEMVCVLVGIFAESVAAEHARWTSCRIDPGTAHLRAGGPVGSLAFSATYANKCSPFHYTTKSGYMCKIMSSWRKLVKF
jgi:hypothetical protein